jgi:asparagine synthetase B (glutamine-hydrolysing)
MLLVIWTSNFSPGVPMAQAGQPFIRVRYGDSCQVEGQPSCVLGHRLPQPAGLADGVFAEWRWDGEQLAVANDRYGFQPLFYFTRPGEIGLAPAVQTLLDRGAPRDLDWDALAVFLRLGFFLGEDTPFRAIRAVPPGAVCRWSRTGLVAQGRPPSWPETRHLDRAAALSTFQELFAEAVRRRRPEGPFALLLSGGRDSRHILFELCRQGFKPDLAATVDLPQSTDGRVAAAVAAELGLRHLRVPAPQRSLTLEQHKNRETHFCADEHAWILPLRDSLQGHFDILYDGIGGDVLSAGLFLDPEALSLFRVGRLADLARALFAREHPVPVVPRLLNAETARKLGEERAVERLTAELRRHAGAPNPCGSFFFWNRTRREIALSPFSIFGAFRVFAPFLDHDVVDFLGALPADLFLDHTFHDQVIAQAYPRWAHLPYAVKKEPRFRFADLAPTWQMRRRLRGRRQTDLNLSYLLPRLLRAGLDPRYNRRSIGFLTTLPAYWAQLENLVRGEASQVPSTMPGC